MRTDNLSFALAWRKDSITAHFVFKIDFGGSDFVYLTSHTISGLSGPNVYTGVLTEDISGTSQKISPEKSVSTIGEITFSAMDDGLTTLQKTKLNAGKGLRGKKVVFYVGEDDFPWSNFVVATTQVIKSVEYENGIYTFSCADVQRDLRQDIFDVKKTTLSASIAENAATIPVYGTTGFQLVRQPASPSGIIGSPGQKVGYIKLSNGCIVKYTGITPNSFTGCTWGVLNTAHLIAPIDKDDDSNADNAPKVEEYIYREGPAVMIAYELMTGACWGFPGDYLPDHWHLGISPDLIRTSDFQFIGPDWWDTTNNDVGVAAVISGVTKTDGKKFIEEQIYTMLGAFSPIYANGEIGLKRLAVVHSAGSYTRLLTASDVSQSGALLHDMESVINQITIRWNYLPEKKDYTRVNILRDTASISKHGTAKPKELAFKTLSSSRHSYDVLKNRFDSLRDRFAGPPLKIKVTLLPKHNDLEVGDVVRLRLPNVRDYTGEITTLDRNFEIQQLATNWKTGEVTVDLFGSSQPASPVSSGSGNEPANAIPDAWYTNGGTAITAANFPGKITTVGSLTRITGNITLAGGDNSLTVFYCNGSLTIDSGVTVTVTKNVLLKVKGFFQVNGKIDGKGKGVAGATTSAAVAAKYLGNTQSGWGLRASKGDNGETSSLYQKLGPVVPPALTGKAHDYAPYLSISTSGSTVRGIPTIVCGTPGPKGGDFVRDSGVGSWQYERGGTGQGGAGGASGAGMVVVCRGADIGSSGVVDTSGMDGAEGDLMQLINLTPSSFYRAGSGGGGFCGAVYWLIDGTQNNAPSLNASNSKAEVGIAPQNFDALYAVDRFRRQLDWLNDRIYSFGLVSGAVMGKVPGAFSSRENTYQVNHRVQFLTGESEANPDIGFAKKPSAIVLTEATNTPKTAQGNLSTIEVSVTPPVDTNYAYSHISYRKQGLTAWFDVGPASPEALITVASDGTTYEVRAQSVNKAGQKSETFIYNTITVVNITAEYASILLLDNPAIQLKTGGTTFDGRDAHFIFTDSNFQNQHWAYYEIKVYNGATLLRTEQVTDRAWSYTSEKNREDGNYRTFTLKVAAVGLRGQKTAETVLTVSNPAPTSTLNTAVPGFKIFKLYMTEIADSDFRGWKVYVSTTNGFTPSTSNLAYQGKNSPITIDNLNDNTTYYYRIRAYDEFGDGTLEVQRSIVTDGGISLEYGDGELGPGEQLQVNGQVIVTRGTTQTIIGPVNQGSYYSLLHTKIGSAVIFDVKEGGDVVLGDQLSDNYVMWDQSANTLIVKGDVTATNIAAGATISAPTITGGTIQTASSGERVSILASDNKFHGYWNSGDGTVRDNVKVGNLSNADGAFAIEIGSSNYRHGGIWLQANGGYTATGIHLAGFTTGIKSTASTTATGAYGVQGTSTLGTGVRGETYADNTAGYAGVVGIAFDGSDGTGVYGTGNGTAAKGVHGQTNTGLGVHGEATGSGTGVKGVATSGAGVKGEATTGIGVSAKATGSGGVPLKLEGVAGSTSGGHIYAVPMAGDANHWPSAAAPDGTLAVVIDQFGWPQLWIKTTNAVYGVNGGWRRFQWDV